MVIVREIQLGGFIMNKILTLIVTLVLCITTIIPISGIENQIGSLDRFVKIRTYEGFKDVSDEWYSEDVEACFELGIMSGKGEGVFDPTGEISIAETITMASRVHAIYNDNIIDEVENKVFWYDKYIKYAVDNNIIKSSEFSGHYEDLASRAELGYMFYNSIDSDLMYVKNDVTTLPDMTESDKYFAEVLSLYRAGILTGADDLGTSKHGENVIRAESSALINRVIRIQNRKVTTFWEATEPVGPITGSEYAKMLEYKTRDEKYIVRGITVDYGHHTYLSKDQAEYDAVMEVLRGVYNNRSQYDIVSSDFWEMYKYGTLEGVLIKDLYNGVRLTRNMAFYDVFTEEQVFNLVQHTAALYRFLGESGGSSLGYGESAYDLLFGKFGDCNAVANSVSAYYDIAGYNTRQRYNNAHAWCEIEVNNIWYEVQGSYIAINPHSSIGILRSETYPDK